MKNILKYFLTLFLFDFLMIPAVSYAADTAITIRAKGSVAANIWPHMVLTVNGTKIKEWTVSSTGYKDYTASASLKAGSNSFSVAFDNDGTSGSEDRNLYVNYIKIGSTEVEAESSIVVYDRASKTREDIPGQEAMKWNGALIFTYDNSCSPSCTSTQTCQSGVCVTLSLAEEFFGRINLDYKGLEKVKTAVSRSDYGIAEKEFVTYMKNRTSPKYFFDWKKKIELVAGTSSAAKTTQITAADVSLAHKFTFGNNLTLTIDFNKGTEWTQSGGEWTASLNRCQWLYTLGRAYWFTDNEKYAKEFVFITTDWIKDNEQPASPARTTNPWRTLDTGIRMNYWVMAYHYFIDSSSLTPDFNAMFFNSLAKQADYVGKDLEVWQAGNWSVGEAGNLLTMGIMFPEFKNASEWKKRASSTLAGRFQGDGTHEAEYYEDGGYVELTPGYHGNGSCYNLLAQKNGDTNPLGINMNTCKAAYEWMYKISEPGAKMPAIGDTDTGRNIKSFSTEGAYAFSDPYLKYFTNTSAGLDSWYYDETERNKYAAIVAKKPNFTSIKLPNSQYVVMRSGWNSTDKYLLFDCAPYGSGHSHSDALNIIVDSGTNQEIIDPGRGLYNYDDPLEYSWYRTARAHNVIVVDGNSGNNANSDPKPEITDWFTSNNFDFAGCSIASKTTASNKHIRRVFFAKPNYWIVSDLVEGNGSHKLEMLYHPGDYEIYKSDIISLDNITPGKATEPIPAGSASISAIGSPYLKFTKTGTSLPTTFTTLIYPDAKTANIASSKLTVKLGTTTIADTIAQGFKITIAKENANDYFLISHSTAAARTYGDIVFDGQTAYLRETNNILSKVNIIGGTNLKYKDFSLSISGTKATATWGGTNSISTTICNTGIKESYRNSKKLAATIENDCLAFTVPGTATCTNECISGAKQCDGAASYKTCTTVNSCLKWGAAANCPTGQTCFGAGVCSTACISKTCTSLNYQCGNTNDGCGNTLDCGTCGGNQVCQSGTCITQSSGNSGGSGEVGSSSGGSGSGGVESQKQLTRTQILQKITEIKQLLIQLIVQLIAELQKQLAAMSI